MRFHEETSRRFPVLHAGAWLPWPWIRRIALSAAAVLAAGAIGCSTRSDTPTMAPDSTLVYASRLPNDVSARITFHLRDSKKRAEEQRRARELARQLAREKKEERLRLERERKEKERVEREKAKQAKKAKKGKKGSKSKKSRTATEAGETSARRDLKAGSDLTASAEPAAIGESAAGSSGGSGGARDAGSTPGIDRAGAAASSGAEAASPDSGAEGMSSAAPVSTAVDLGERAFDLEEGAKVQATVTIENSLARGNRPLLLHLVWLNPAKKRCFKKMIEWTPSDSTFTLTGSFTISPAKRTAGFYSLQVFLFRELIAEKSFELRGTSTAVEEKESEGGM